MAIDLRAKQAERFRDGCLSAFPSWNDLDQLLELDFEKSLDAMAARGDAGPR